MAKSKVALIMRSDEIIKEWNLQRVTVDTSFGPIHHCYEGTVYGVEIFLLYGRFNGQKIPSAAINYQQYIEAVVLSGARKLIGTFVVGGINPERCAGSVYVLGDLVGMGGYNFISDQRHPFHNAEMYHPFCPNLTYHLEQAAEKMPFNVIKKATYVCFHGWPRIETAAELTFYHKMGWDIVGQTCDPEATMARLSGLCYGGVAVQIDDPMHREKDTSPQSEKPNSANTNSIKDFRKKTTAIILQYLRDFQDDDCTLCVNVTRKNNSFREFPDFYYE